jgi:AraC family transcriptional regulator
MTMTTMQMTGSSTGAPAWTDHDETHDLGWPPAARAKLGTLPLSRLRRVTEHIQEHLDQDLTLARLGAVVYMSPYHFARLFQRSTGVPPHQFVVRTRIDRAVTLLAARELSIARISRAVGFRTASHFSTVFRRVTGVTPRAYRARHLHAARPGGA